MSLKQELEREKVSDLDLSEFCQVAPGTAVSEAIKKMQATQSKVCLVTQDKHLKGILTDRDVLRKIAVNTATFSKPVESVMTKDPVTINPTTTAAYALWLMDDKHFRNLPVVDRTGNVVGNMTHQAVINYLAARYPVEVLNRPNNPDNFPNKPEGGD